MIRVVDQNPPGSFRIKGFPAGLGFGYLSNYLTGKFLLVSILF